MFVVGNVITNPAQKQFPNNVHHYLISELKINTVKEKLSKNKYDHHKKFS